MPPHVNYARESRPSSKSRSRKLLVLGLNAALLPVLLVYLAVWCVIEPWFHEAIAFLPKRGGAVESVMAAAWWPSVACTLIVIPLSILTRSRAVVLLAALNGILCGSAMYKYLQGLMPAY